MAVEFVGIELQLRGADGVKSDLQQIDNLLNSFRGRKKVDAGLQQLKRDIVAARGELEKFRRLQEEAGGKGKSAWADEMYKRTANELRDLQQAQREVIQANREMGKTFGQTFNAISSKVAHVGSAMQSMGNALVRLTSPFERLTTGLLYGAGFKALNTFTSGLSRGFTRYDTMKKYPKVMQAFGYFFIATYDLVATVLRIPYDEEEFMLPLNTVENAVKIAINNPSAINEGDLFFDLPSETSLTEKK